MKTKTKLFLIGISIIVLALTICFFSINKNKTTKDTNIIEMLDIEATFEEDDEDLNWENDNVEYIDLNSKNKIDITTSGTYYLSGNMNGNVVINAQNKDTVKLVLENANIISENTAPIYVQNAHKVIIIVQEGSTNTLEDVNSYTNPDENEEPNAAIFSKDDLTINGNGILNINAKYEDGVACKDDLKILNVNMNITANDDGVRGKDSIILKNVNLSVISNGDSIKSTNGTDTNKGYIIVQGGTYKLESNQDGIQAETVLKIETGSFDITTGGGSVNNSHNSMEMWQKNGMNSKTTVNETSCKGLKGVTQIQISDGTFKINSSDDSIHSNGVIVIDGGIFEIESGDDRNSCRC